jgi:hypothetical protein
MGRRAPRKHQEISMARRSFLSQMMALPFFGMTALSRPPIFVSLVEWADRAISE